MSLKGWSLPFSPKGLASTLSPPPWHYSGDMIAIEFSLDVKTIASLLPSGLEASDSDACMAVFADWCSSADSDPRLAADPRRGQYKEAFIIVPAQMKGQPATRVPYIWVDNEVAHLRGHAQGFPKKVGDIHMTRPVSIGKGGSKKEVGAKFAANVSAMGRLLMTAKVSLEEQVSPADIPQLLMLPILHTRYLPSLDADQPALHENCVNELTDVALGTAFAGKGELEFHASEHEELADLGIDNVGRGYVFDMAMTVTGAKVV